jgi:hypothetical protein
MGKCETSSASLGIKILLSDLILQINETNFNLIKKMLYDGCIEDSNDYYNEAYKKIVGYGYYDTELPEEYLQCKQYLINEFKKHGSYYKSKISSVITPDLSKGSLSEQYLLVPIKKILETDRWGYERYGTNSMSIPINFDLTVNTEEYKDITNFTIIFFIKHHSG